MQIAGWDEVGGHLNDWRSVGEPINNILCRLKCTLVANAHQVPRGSRLLPMDNEEVHIAGWYEFEGRLNDWRSVGQPVSNILGRLKNTSIANAHQVPRGSRLLPLDNEEVQIAGWDEVRGRLNDWRSVGQPINNILCILKCTLVAYTHQVPRDSRLLPSGLLGGLQR